MNFIPKPKHFLIKAIEKTKGGIYIPENAQAINDSIMNEPQEIVLTGPDSEHKVGEYLMLEPHMLNSVVVEDATYFLIPDYRYLGKVPNYVPKIKDTTTSSIILS
jgi:co-chaperonin GroES (HSP10)